MRPSHDSELWLMHAVSRDVTSSTIDRCHWCNWIGGRPHTRPASVSHISIIAAAAAAASERALLSIHRYHCSVAQYVPSQLSNALSLILNLTSSSLAAQHSAMSFCWVMTVYDYYLLQRHELLYCFSSNDPDVQINESKFMSNLYLTVRNESVSNTQQDA